MAALQTVLLQAIVRAAWAATPRVRAVELAAPDGAPLPDWTAGAHVDVTIPGVGSRSYSLIETEPREGPPRAYRLAILLETASRGGSAYMHRLAVGDRVEITPPINQFPLVDAPGEIALVAGGIGVTPLLAMARDLKASGAASRSSMPGEAAPRWRFWGMPSGWLERAWSCTPTTRRAAFSISPASCAGPKPPMSISAGRRR